MFGPWNHSDSSVTNQTSLLLGLCFSTNSSFSFPFVFPLASPSLVQFHAMRGLNLLNLLNLLHPGGGGDREKEGKQVCADVSIHLYLCIRVGYSYVATGPHLREFPGINTLPSLSTCM